MTQRDSFRQWLAAGDATMACVGLNFIYLVVHTAILHSAKDLLCLVKDMFRGHSCQPADVRVHMPQL